MDRHEFTMAVLPTHWQHCALASIFFGVLFGVVGFAPDLGVPRVAGALVLCGGGLLVLLKARKRLHARRDGAHLVVRTRLLERSFPLAEVDHVLEADCSDNPSSLYLVMKDGRRRELLDDDPVTDFGAHLADLAGVPYLLDRYGSADDPVPHPERLDRGD